ncbi:alpha/beta hydrolase fold domain-containing protein [Gordonia sp. DT219]|uniref:alpha/beta hydrolase fold domain-containing protein n=1 Tax=Gordonia sp. DT219 TaxID=3416658 RepID=UPI003CF12B5E
MTSLPARLLIGRIRAQRNKHFYADPAAMRAGLAAHQDPDRSRPPRWLTRRYRVAVDEIDGHDCFTLSPKEKLRSRWHIFHLHGGGFVEAPEPHHWRFAARIVDRLGCTYSLPMYPLAPEHDHRTIVPMVADAYRTVMTRTHPTDRLVFGDSAGGTLALTLVHLLQQAQEPLPVALALFSPWIDLATDDPDSWRIDPTDPELGVTGLRQAGRWYAAGRALDDPGISPAFADLNGYPPLTVFIGTRDILLPDARRIKQLGDAAAVPVELHEYPGMFHNWIMKAILEARTATNELLDFIHGIKEDHDDSSHDR